MSATVRLWPKIPQEEGSHREEKCQNEGSQKERQGIVNWYTYLGFVQLHFLLVIPAKCTFVLSVCLHTKLASKPLYIICMHEVSENIIAVYDCKEYLIKNSTVKCYGISCPVVNDSIFPSFPFLLRCLSRGVGYSFSNSGITEQGSTTNPVWATAHRLNI